MSRDLEEGSYYISHGGNIPVKWTAPEVMVDRQHIGEGSLHSECRPSTTRSTPQPVMCGALGASCMRYGVLDTNHLKSTDIPMNIRS